MFDIIFENEKGEKAMVWQNSWGCSTRTGRNGELIAIPVPYKTVATEELFAACNAAVKSLSEAGIRAESDLRDNYSPGWKYSHWELKGVPLRLEIGPKDLQNKHVRAVRRDNSEKVDIQMDKVVKEVKDMLDAIQQNLFDTAKVKRNACIQVEVENDVKERTKGETGAAKTLCTPFEQPHMPEGTLCFASGKTATKWTYWGRSY